MFRWTKRISSRPFCGAIPNGSGFWQSGIPRRSTVCAFLSAEIQRTRRTAAWVKVTLNQRLFEEEQDLRYAFLSRTYMIMFLLLLVFYLLAHTFLSANVHRYWDKERIKDSNAPEKSVEKRHVNI